MLKTVGQAMHEKTTNISEVYVSIDDIIKRLLPNGNGRFSSFAIQNVTTRVFVEDESVDEAINELLKPFSLNKSRSDYQIEANIVLCDKAPKGMIPPKTAEILENAGGVLQYYADNDLRYIEAPSVGWSIADIKKNKIVVAALKEPQLKTWHIAHHLFYPLWTQLLKKHGIFPLHAAGLVKGGIGILFPAYSGTGKSVLSLNLVRDGYGLLSDDTVFLQEVNDHVIAIGYPEKINLREDARDLFADIPVIDPGSNSSWKTCVDVEALFPDCFVDKIVTKAIVLITRNDRIDSKVEPISRAEALTKLLRYSLFFSDPSTCKDNFELISELVEQSQCFSLDIGTDSASLLNAIDKIVCEVKSRQ